MSHPKEQLYRNRLIWRLKPYHSFASLARQFGLSAERVRKIYERQSQIVRREVEILKPR